MSKRSMNNRGSGIVSVIVTVAFIGMLGTALLFMTYVNYQMKIATRNTQANFYAAEEILDEVRAALQSTVSEAITTSYATTLLSYGELTGAEDENLAQTVFAQNFIKTIAGNIGLGTIPGGVAPSPGQSTAELFYDIDTLMTTIDSYTNVTVADYMTIRPSGGSGKGQAVVRFSSDNVPLSLDLGGIVVTRIDDGYKSVIYTDFSIAFPPFVAVSAGYHSRLNNYIIVADGTLSAGGLAANANVNLSGNIYAGNVEVSGMSYTLDIDSGRIISKGNYNITNGAHLKVGDNASLWANRIYLHSASADFGGNIHLADDLELSGIGSEVAISGSYFGFGFGTGGDNPSAPDPKKSSSIIVSGLDSVLDFRNLNALVLAGRSYVSSTGAGEFQVPTASSLSIKSEQVAYLVPDSLLSHHQSGQINSLPNASIWPTTGGVPAAYTFDPATGDYVSITNPSSVSTTTPTDESYILITLTDALKSYGARVIRRSAPIPSTKDTLVYYFLDFSSEENRGKFFRDYYAEHGDQLGEFLRLYLDPNHANAINPGGAFNATGYIYEFAADGSGYELRAPVHAEHIRAMAATYAGQFKNLTTTLFELEAAAEGETPFHYFVDTAAIVRDHGSGSNPVKFTDSTGKVRALIIPGGSFELTDAYPDVNLIIACGTGGTVTLRRSFDGLVLSAGNVRLAESLSSGTHMTDGSGGDLMYGAFNATNGGYLLLDYMKGSTKGGAPTLIGEGAKTWNLNDLVTYKNWSKNEIR